MSSVLHPVGPEPEERYWVRRVAVLAAVLVALVVIVALVTSATRAGSAVQAAPAPPPPPAPVPVNPTPAAPATMSPAATASPTVGATSTPSASPTVKPSSDPTRATAPAQKTPAQKTPAQKTPAQKTPAQKKAPVLAACPADELRTTFTGKRSLRVKQRARFDLSLINGSGRSCYLRVTGENVSLTISSGRDRIWSSKDCGNAVPTLSRKLGREQALKWSMTWNGRRSAKGCETRPEIPRPGTYWATAQFDNAKPVRLRMVLHA